MIKSIRLRNNLISCDSAPGGIWTPDFTVISAVIFTSAVRSNQAKPRAQNLKNYIYNFNNLGFK